jgi:hypothetical protein
VGVDEVKGGRKEIWGKQQVESDFCGVRRGPQSFEGAGEAQHKTV